MTDAMKKVGAGRPAIDSQAALRDVLSDPSKREVFVESIERLVQSKEAVNLKADLYKDDLGSTAEAYKLGKGFLSNVVNEVVKGELQETLDALSDKSDILELFADRLAVE